MKLNRSLILLAGLSLLLTACSKDENEAVAVINETDSNPFLAYVPADTPYVSADLESLPEEISDAYLARFQPVLDTMNEQTDEFRNDYASGEYEGEASAMLASAILDELDGEISEEGLQVSGEYVKADQIYFVDN